MNREATAIKPLWVPFVLFVVVSMIAAIAGCESSARQGSRTPSFQPRSEEDIDASGIIDPDGTVPELGRFTHSGANDIRDILLVDGGFLVATGKGTVRYALKADGPALVGEYFHTDGLPSDNCFLLKLDAAGGVWALCEGGVGFLAKGAREWAAFSGSNGLPPGTVTSLQLSPAGGRVWVTTTGGLATASVGTRRWQAYPARNPIDVFVSPDETKVWSRRLLPSRCGCGRHILTSQLDLQSGTWSDVPDSGNCSHVAFRPAHFCARTG
ncbi:MAG: hypothetical protein ACYS5V_02645, partial [Planctomycetota bacterium]